MSYLKNNRLLTRGSTRPITPEIAVHGDAVTDPNFIHGGDQVRYVVALGRSRRPLRVNAELLYQPSGYRRMLKLSNNNAAEPQRFIDYFAAISTASATILAYAAAATPL